MSGEKGDKEPPECHAKEQAASSERGLPGLRDEGVPNWQVVIAVLTTVWQYGQSKSRGEVYPIKARVTSQVVCEH